MFFGNFFFLLFLAWKQKYADRFLAFRERARSTVRVVQATVYILALPYWYMGLVKNFTVDVRHFVCFAYLPFFILYSAFGADKTRLETKNP